jgi:hypothetical protein
MNWMSSCRLCSLCDKFCDRTNRCRVSIRNVIIDNLYFSLNDSPEIQAEFGASPRIAMLDVMGDGDCFYRSQNELLALGLSPIESRKIQVQWIKDNFDSPLAWNMTVEQVIATFYKCSVVEYCQKLLDPNAEQDDNVFTFRWGTELELLYLSRFVPPGGCVFFFNQRLTRPSQPGVRIATSYC